MQKSHFMQKHDIRKRIYCFMETLGRGKSTESLINSCKRTGYRSILLEIFDQRHTSKIRISLKFFSLNLQKMKLELIFS